MAVTYDHSASLTTLTADVRNDGEYKENALPDARVTPMINAGIVRAGHVISRYAPERANQTSTVNVVAGTATHTIPAEAEVLSLHATKPVTQLHFEIKRQDGELVLAGEAWCYTFSGIAV